MTSVAISHIESGKVAEPHLTSRVAIAAALGRTVSELWPRPGQELPRDLRDYVANDGGRRKRVRRKTLSEGEQAELIRRNGWSTAPSDEFGGFSEADWQLSYVGSDPDTHEPLTIELPDGTVGMEQAPGWFRAEVRRARAARRATRVAAPSSRHTAAPRRPQGRRRRAHGTRRGAPSSADDSGPGQPEPQQRGRRR
jgi:hypothetical protein